MSRTCTTGRARPLLKAQVITLCWRDQNSGKPPPWKRVQIAILTHQVKPDHRACVVAGTTHETNSMWGDLPEPDGPSRWVLPTASVDAPLRFLVAEVPIDAAARRAGQGKVVQPLPKLATLSTVALFFLSKTPSRPVLLVGLTLDCTSAGSFLRFVGNKLSRCVWQKFSCNTSLSHSQSREN